MSKRKRILVTGGMGFIGSHLVERLVKENHEVWVLDDCSNTNVEKYLIVTNAIPTTRIFQDVTHKFPLGFPEDYKFDVIYHLACHPRSTSLQNPFKDLKTNTQLTLQLLFNIQKSKNKTKIIYTSNSGIYSTKHIPINESCEDDPKTPYDLNKKFSEEYIKLYSKTYGIPYTIFRLATIYGPRQNISEGWKPVIAEFISKAKQKEPMTIHGDGTQTRDFLYVDDVVNALMLAMNNGNGQTMILGTNRECSINHLRSIICSEAVCLVEPEYGPRLQGDIDRMKYDYSKAKSILGWEPEVTLEEGVRGLIKGS